MLSNSCESTVFHNLSIGKGFTTSQISGAEKYLSALKGILMTLQKNKKKKGPGRFSECQKYPSPIELGMGQELP